MKNPLLSFLFFCMFVSCGDRIETEFKNYKEADDNKFFDKNWIPKKLVYQSMTNIYLQNNIDLNSAIFTYNLASSDLDNLKTKIQKSKIEYKNLEGINVPHSLSKKINDSEIFYIIQNTDTSYLAIDNENKKVVGWTYH